MREISVLWETRRITVFWIGYPSRLPARWMEADSDALLLSQQQKAPPDGDAFLLVGEGGFDCPHCGAMRYGEHQFLNWCFQQATGLLNLNGFESAFLYLTNKKTPPSGDVFSLVGEGGFDCPHCGAMRYGKHQFLNWCFQQATGLLNLNGFESAFLYPTNKKAPPDGDAFLLVGEGGFEPPKL